MASFHPPRGRKILVVEDQCLIRSCTADFLEDAGYTVLEASNSTEALSILLRHPEIALLLTDIEMPGGSDGLTLAEVACWHIPAIRALIVSGRQTLGQDQIPKGSHFVAKPYSPQKIIETVKALLA